MWCGVVWWVVRTRLQGVVRKGGCGKVREGRAERGRGQQWWSGSPGSTDASVNSVWRRSLVGESIARNYTLV
jgi:hypothetical protein